MLCNKIFSYIDKKNNEKFTFMFSNKSFYCKYSKKEFILDISNSQKGIFKQIFLFENELPNFYLFKGNYAIFKNNEKIIFYDLKNNIIII